MNTSKKLMIYFFPLVLALLILAIIIIFCMGFRMQELLNDIDKLKEIIQGLNKELAEHPWIEVIGR